MSPPKKGAKKPSSNAKTSKPKGSARPKAGGAVGSLQRLPGAALLAGLVGGGLGWWASNRPMTEEAIAAWLPLGARDAATAALLFGPLCAFALGRGLLGGLWGALLGLFAAGLCRPLALIPENWGVVALGLVLGGAAMAPPERAGLRRVAMILALGGAALALGNKGLVWALSAAAGLLAAAWPPGWLFGLRRVLGYLIGTLALGGALMTVNAGFTRVTLVADRALIAEWNDPFGREDPALSRILPGTSHTVFWTAGKPLRFRTRLDGLSFQGLPPVAPGPELPPGSPDARDLAELGMAVDCPALLDLALAGDRRARVQAVFGRCDPGLEDLAGADPSIDAARVLLGRTARKPVSILASPVELPLNEPGAVLLCAAVRLGAPRAAAQAMVDGSSYDRAVLLAHLSDEDRAAIRPLIEEWSADVPGSAGQVYREALSALALKDPSGN